MRTPKRGIKKGKVSSVYNSNSQDIANEYDNDRLIGIYESAGNDTRTMFSKVVPISVDIVTGGYEIEDVSIDSKNVVRVVKEDKSKKKEKLTPFTWGTKEWKEKIFDISAFQGSPLANPNSKENRRKGQNWDGKYGSENFTTAPKDYGYNTRIMDYFGNMELTSLLKMDKWIDFQEYMKEGGETNRHGYNMSKSDWGGSSEPFWNLEYPLIFKKIEKAEREVLAPLMIKNKEQLEEEIESLNTETKLLETKKEEVGDEGNLALRIEEIEKRIALEKKEGLRTASTYKNRAKEFAESNSDYAGNNYLDILSIKYLLDTISSVEEFRETSKYQELTIKERNLKQSHLKTMQ